MTTCAICGEASGGKRFCSAVHEKPCVVCGKLFAPKNIYRFEQTRACSTSCRSALSHTPEAQEKRVANSQARYGTDRPQKSASVKAKTRATNEERYGAAWPNQNDAVREKGYSTNERRYGARHPLQAEAIRQKAADTLETNFGVRHPSQAPELRRRAEATLLARYGVKHSWQSSEVQAKIRAFYREAYGVDYPSQVPEIREKILESYSATVNAEGYSGYGRISKTNLRWKALIEERLPGVVLEVEKHVKGKSFDLFLPEARLLIDINPTATHNGEVSFACLISGCEQPCEDHAPLPHSHHLERAKLAQAEGYSLLQLYDWDSPAAALELIAGKAERGYRRFSARKLHVAELSNADANAFLELYHIQGKVAGQRHRYGFFTADGELLAVATFGPKRFGAQAEAEWLRYAVKRGVIIHGGASRLFQHYVESIKPASVISYVNFDHTTAGRLFLHSCGFEELAPTGASLVWSKGAKRIYHNSLLRLGADRLLGTAYGTPELCGLRNGDIMQLEGWLPVYTSGNRVFRWETDYSQA